MRNHSTAILTTILVAALVPCGRASQGTGETGDESIVAVSSKVSADYSRHRAPDGSFETEAIAFGKGGV
jgi:hypothetical protein